MRRTTGKRRREDSPTIDRVLALRRRREREASGLFFVEGVRFVKQALDVDARVEQIIVAKRLLRSPLGQKIARMLRQAGVPRRTVSPDLFLRVSQAPEPQGIGAIVRQRWLPLRRARPEDGLCWVALHEVRSPGNLGTILRTCQAVGGAGLILLGDQVDPYDPAAVRGSMGAVFHQKLVRTTHHHFHQWAKARDCLVVGTSPHAEIDFDEPRFPERTVIVLGDERNGLSPREKDVCDLIVRIPMVGHTDSLNVGVAAGVLLYQVFLARRPGAEPRQHCQPGSGETG